MDIWLVDSRSVLCDQGRSDIANVARDISISKEVDRLIIAMSGNFTPWRGGNRVYGRHWVYSSGGEVGGQVC